MKAKSFSQILLSILFVTMNAFANEAPKEEVKVGPPTSEQELTELQGRVQTLHGKVEAREKEVKKLSEEAQKADTPNEKSEIAKQLSLEYQELQKDTRSYNEALYRLKYQFPERGTTKLSEEKMKEIKTLRELEEQHSLEGRIKKNMKVIRQTFGKKEPGTPGGPETPKVEKVEPPADPLLQPVIIRK